MTYCAALLSFFDVIALSACYRSAESPQRCSVPRKNASLQLHQTPRLITCPLTRVVNPHVEANLAGPQTQTWFKGAAAFHIISLHGLLLLTLKMSGVQERSRGSLRPKTLWIAFNWQCSHDIKNIPS